MYQFRAALGRKCAFISVAYQCVTGQIHFLFADFPVCIQFFIANQRHIPRKSALLVFQIHLH